MPRQRAVEELTAAALRPPRALRLTGMGALTLFLGLALISSRWWLPTPFPATLGVALLAALLAAAWIGPQRLRRLAGGWTLTGPFHVGEEAAVSAWLGASASAPPLVLEAFNPVTGQRDPVLRLKSLAIATVKPAWILRFPRRGLMQLPPLVARSEQPFGVWSMAQPVGVGSDVVVLPALGMVTAELRTRLRSWLESHTTTSDAGEDELAALRAYRPGDSPRRVHWRASARHRHLLVAERHAVGCRRLAIVVDTATGSDRRALEKMLSAAATVIDALDRDGWHLTLHGAFAPQGLIGQRAVLLEALALATTSTRAVGEFVLPEIPSLVFAQHDPVLGDRRRAMVVTLADLPRVVRLTRRER